MSDITVNGFQSQTIRVSHVLLSFSFASTFQRVWHPVKKNISRKQNKTKGNCLSSPTSLPIQILIPSILSWWDLWCMGGMKMASFICSCLDTEEREYHVCCELTCQKLKSKAWAAGRLNLSVCSHPDNDGNEAEDDDGAKVACPWTHPWHNTFLLHVSLLMAPSPPPSPVLPPLRISTTKGSMLHQLLSAFCPTDTTALPALGLFL